MQTTGLFSVATVLLLEFHINGSVFVLYAYVCTYTCMCIEARVDTGCFPLLLSTLLLLLLLRQDVSRNLEVTDSARMAGQ